jgi:hypothetical protein
MLQLVVQNYILYLLETLTTSGRQQTNFGIDFQQEIYVDALIGLNIIEWLFFF